MSYTDFLTSKHITVAPAGFDTPPGHISPVLFEWQNAIVRWALGLGKAALFEECGLGNSMCGNDARHAYLSANGRNTGQYAVLAICELCQEELRLTGEEVTTYWRERQIAWGVQ